MPKKKQQSTSKEAGKHPFVKFVNFYLTKADKEKIAKAAADAEDVLSQMSALIEEGYAFKVSWDGYSDCFQALMIGETTVGYNQGYIQTGRHTDLTRCLAIVLYQHYEFSGGFSWEKEGVKMFDNDW